MNWHTRIERFAALNFRDKLRLLKLTLIVARANCVSTAVTFVNDIARRYI